MKKAIFLALFMCFALSGFSQINLVHNAIRPGDEIIKQQVEYKDPGRSGENVVWNFSKLKAVNPEYKLTYHPASLVDDSLYIMGRDTISKKDVGEDDLIMGVEHYTMYYYRIKEDTLFCLGHENPVTLMHHKEPLAVISYPLNYKQTLNKPYQSQGLYSSQEPLKTSGNVIVESDAFGMMILPSGDTLNHVLRIKSIQTILEADSLRLLDENPMSIEVETYKWYAKGYRYPVFEAIRSFDVADIAKTESFNVAFFYPPQEHYYLADDLENLAVIDSLWNEKHKPQPIDPNNPNGNMNQANGFNYNFYPNPVQDNLYVEYMLDKNSDITLTIYDMNGRAIKTHPQKTLKTGLYTEEINCQDLPKGNYILHLKVNQEIVNEKIIKK